jgi:aerobic-type carbon monoxide dehydrogenase small subunit (CoxS/CutS family)
MDRVATATPAAEAIQRVGIVTLEKPTEQHHLSVRINGEWLDFEVGREIQQTDTLAYLLREKLGLTGLKISCDQGQCGACTVIMDGKAILSCMTLAVEANGHEILTVEGLKEDNPIVEAFAEQSEPGYGTALQCGHCTPGFIMVAKALLDANPRPTLYEVREALSGNICRCGCYAAIAQAVLHASEKITERADKK